MSQHDPLVRVAHMRDYAAEAMRNLLVHGYDIIEHEILWETITSDLPPLVESLRGILDA